MSEPLVSIVLPTYNRAHLLRHAIRSILAQTYANLELIIVDDNSNDGTPEVARSFADARIRYVRNEKNLKLPGALNKGFALARGSFLTWTSDDNLYASNAIERMVAVLESQGCDFVFADYFDFSRHDEAGRPVDPRRISLPGTLRLEERNSVGACFLYTQEVHQSVGAYDTELFLVEDYDYFIRVQKQGFSVRHVPEPLYYFSRHDDALFCTRFAEVQAADILVRYKNQLLDEERAVEACVRLVMRNLRVLKNPHLRRFYLLLRRTSFRLTRVCESLLGAYLARSIRARVHKLLKQFSSRTMPFAQAKDALRDLLQGYVTLEYK